MIRPIIKLLEWLDRIFLTIEVFFVCLTLSLMLGVSFLQVILRNFLDSGLTWADILVRHLVLLLLFFGASLSTRTKRHIQMDISSQIIPKRWKPALGLVINAFCVFITFYLYQASMTLLNLERDMQSNLFMNVQVWHFLLVMPLGFAMIGIRFAMNWVVNVLELLGLKKPEPDTHGIPIDIPQEGRVS